VQLLVSVRDAGEATAALTGGAQVVDAKDPAHGALGAVSPHALARIAAVIPEEIPLSVALGDALAPPTAFQAARAAVRVGARFVKLGFLGVHGADGITASIEAAVDGTAGCARVVAAAYADWECAGAPSPEELLELAAGAGAHVVLLDTAAKAGRRLFELMSADDVGAWVDAAHAHGLLAALAGSLDASGVAQADDLGADVAGVRGAACAGGREGRVTAARVRELARIVAAVSA
jgi:uncharacterized protein (UPF0264 family)